MHAASLAFECANNLSLLQKEVEKDEENYISVTVRSEKLKTFMYGQ